eukprot:2418285-Pyramimonas_sp.AAC.1
MMDVDEFPLLGGEMDLSVSVEGDVAGYVYLQTYDMLPFQNFIAYGSTDLSAPTRADVNVLHYERSWEKTRLGRILGLTRVPGMGKGASVF